MVRAYEPSWDDKILTFHNRLMDNFRQSHSNCGTVGCIAGEVVMMEHSGCYPANHIDPHSFAVDTLCINEMYGGRTILCPLFYLSDWPNDLNNKYRACITLSEEREVMCEAIDRYIEDPKNFSGWTR